ncbi:response regulator transcription factor [Lacibacter sp. H375]|uniref:response regulator transcription factor n=1 Tax=Lacibacter sp. H375 TaxID=3133424 RepID=UPI0030C43CF6
MSNPIKIVIADDHSLFREGIQLLLKKEKSIELAGEACDGEALLALIEDVKPDVVITDIDMPIKNGVEVTRIVKRAQPNTGVLALTMFGQEELVVDMMEAGANGYLLKSSKKEELLQAIQTASEGGSYFCEQTSVQLSKMIAASKVSKKQEEADLSATEIEVMRLICEQKANKEIADQLELAVKTIEKIRTKIFEKTGSTNLVGVAIYAIKHGYYKP